MENKLWKSVKHSQCAFMSIDINPSLTISPSNIDKANFERGLLNSISNIKRMFGDHLVAITISECEYNKWIKAYGSEQEFKAFLKANDAFIEKIVSRHE